MTDHHHHHDHHKKESNMTFDEKLNTLITHWLHHNADHAKNYKDWSEKTRDAGKEEIADILNEVSEMTEKISEKFSQALSLI